MYQDFAREFWGCTTYSSDIGFIAFRELKENPAFLVIYWLYVLPKHRGTRDYMTLFNQVLKFATEKGYTHLLAEVDTQYGTPNKNIQLYIYHGFEVCNAENNRIVLKYTIEENACHP